MVLVKKIIVDNSKRFGQFSYYELVIEKIEKNIISNPDIAIEACKALIEGVSKTILITLDKTLTEHDVKHYKLPKLFKDTILKLSDANKEFEIEFISSFSHTVKLIGEIRTHRGDIAHGKPVPKSLFSSIEFAKFIEQTTSSIVIYMLEYFFTLEVSTTEDIPYKDSSKFNQFLDESTPLGYIKYSKALYEQDYDSYLEQLKEFETEEMDNSEEMDNFESEEVTTDKIQAEPSQEKTIIVQDRSEEINETYESLLVNQNNKDALYALCQEKGLYVNEVLKIIETYLFDNRNPLSSKIINSLKVKPKLLDRRVVVEIVTKDILRYIKEYLGEK